MARLFPTTVSTWRDPFRAEVVQERRDDDRLILTMRVRLRYWHPRLWWMALRMIVRSE